MLYLECASGISGDMAVAALLDLGTPAKKAAREQMVLDVLHSLPVQGFDIRISRVEKSGLDACDFNVVLDESHENYDHDMNYLYGHLENCPEHGHEHMHGHVHGHEHMHGHVHASTPVRHMSDKPTHHHEHRNYADVCAIINASSASEGAKDIARNIFAIVAEAEAKAHGSSIEQVHFHEVGAIDSIADILAFAVCFDDLKVSDVVITELAEGKGSVRCQHGIIPVPVPAVVNIVSEHAVPLRIIDVQGELVTPTGAAIAAAVRTQDKLPERFTIQAVGLGAGKRIYHTPGLVRAMLIEKA